MKAFSLEELVYIRDALDKCANQMRERGILDYDELHIYNLHKSLSSEFQDAINTQTNQ